MKKALLAALCFIIVGLVLVNGTFALPDFDEVFQWIKELGEKGIPEQGGAGTPVHVELVSDDEPKNLFPGGEASRSFCVKNLGEGDVYFRLVYAVQYDAETWPKLDITFDAEDGFDASGWIDITISQTPYKMKVFTYTNALTATESSPNVSISIAMDESVTSEQLANYRSDFLQTQVLAIEAAPFTDLEQVYDAKDALELALPLDKLNPF